jgi:hypothetical protein
MTAAKTLRAIGFGEEGGQAVFSEGLRPAFVLNVGVLLVAIR